MTTEAQEEAREALKEVKEAITAFEAALAAGNKAFEDAFNIGLWEKASLALKECLDYLKDMEPGMAEYAAEQEAAEQE